MKRSSACGIVLGGLLAFVVLGAQLFADVLVFDRGLPTANLNNAAGASRSNVAWADEPTTTPPHPVAYLPGDDFTLASPTPVTKIRVWSVIDLAGLKLHLVQGSTNTTYSTYTPTSVAYTNSETYQGSSGTHRDLYQLDFAVNTTLNGSYNFFLDSADNSVRTPFLHASNAALSGSTQQGADGVFKWYNPIWGSVLTWDSGTGAGTSGFAAGWDKNSDANVQIFAVPEASSVLALSLFGLGVAGMTWWRRQSSAT